jgi:hypothetical protein
MMQKLLRPFELALLAVIGAVEWVIGWVEPRFMQGCGNGAGRRVRGAESC